MPRVTRPSPRAAKPTVQRVSQISTRGTLFARRFPVVSAPPTAFTTIVLPDGVEAMKVFNNSAVEIRVNFNTEDITSEYITVRANGGSLGDWIPIDDRTTMQARGTGAAGELEILFRG